jgi:predicted nucleic acid-binding protein
VLVDTSVWIDHFRRGNAALAERLAAGDVWVHPFVIGELACGQLTRRSEILVLLEALPQVPLVEHPEVLAFVETNGLPGRGIGWIDAHLLASARLARIRLWTLDRRLAAIAGPLGLAGASR